MESFMKASEHGDIAMANTLTEQAASFLERDVLSGALPPGTKLVIGDLVKRYGIGATPVREGLSRLVTQGFVQAISQRGFRVAAISEADLRDVTNVRQLIEVEALRLSIAQGDDEWESNIVAALHKIQLFTRKGEEVFREGATDFDDVHRGFHTALLAACGSPRLLELHRNLYDQAYRYRRLMMVRHEARENFYDEHKALAEVVLRRDSAFACKLVADHLQRTLTYVYPDRKYR
ncbi:GntR family transcriptional regulator [Paraburkholderia sp. BL6665CI2N2]|uniref:GntR family transcriptional regulator n=1 Tax=Paraburkholderia sp. BL6665CI2N2 TaxID=1938806 RepID=UPI0010D41715|nr:FCD domain-containing protein [Paraburkholderia sp. BL6665CI2N2]TDY16971.1 GntR family transcriptional regulator [Paraburkholderia sp. BL6665CI2N2]